MTKKTAVSSKKDAIGDLQVLDDLIRRCYRKLIAEVEDNPKLGDLLKMIELRRKLTPQDATQKELWKLLEQVRKDVLGSGHDATGVAASTSDENTTPRK